MPRSKRKFIDKKKAISFYLVNRSQKDPLIADEKAPQHVLVPAVEKPAKDDPKRKEELKKYGIYFDDDYNYLQHLREVNTKNVEWVSVETPVMKKQKKTADFLENDETRIKLPSSVFASEVEECVGLLNKAAPHSGLRLDVDPDIIAAMDEDFDFDDPENQLDDDFIALANTTPSDDSQCEEDSESDEYTSCETEDENDEIRSLNESQFCFMEEETKSRFTNYSMSSSVIRRNEQLTLLDDKFERIFASYDDNEIGALEGEEIEGYVPTDSERLVQYAEEFKKSKEAITNFTENMQSLHNLHSSSDEEELIKVPVTSKSEDKWDCESFLSTYSNIYNHPKLIPENFVPKRIKVSGSTGIPLGVLDSGKLTAKALERFNTAGSKICDQAESIVSHLSTLSIRPKDENPEEKRERKRNLKDYRQERRMERKANTLAFKDEKKRQEKVLLNQKINQQGIKIL